MLQALGSTGTTCHQARPFIDARLDMALNAIELRLADHGPHGGGGITRIAQPELADFVDQIRHQRFDLALMNEHAARRMTGLTSVEEAALDVPASGFFQVCIL
ncbi:hypothetical protein D3C80_880220 [compost metagenome]